jgi:hypothetical protein
MLTYTEIPSKHSPFASGLALVRSLGYSRVRKKTIQLEFRVGNIREMRGELSTAMKINQVPSSSLSPAGKSQLEFNEINCQKEQTGS